MIRKPAIFVKQTTVYFAITSLLMVSLLIGIAGFEYYDELELAAIPNQPSEAPKGSVAIVIKVPARVLELHNDGKLYKKYRIAVGKSETPTPIGDWTVTWKSYRSGDIMGTRFLGLDVPWGTSLLEYTKNTYITAYNLTDNYLPLYFV